MDSKTVFELRNEAKDLNGINKANKLNEALQIANNLYQSEPYDEWIQKAFAWVLIDLCKYYIPVNNLNQALIHFNQLNTIQFDYPDDIIENQKTYLKPKIDTNYQVVNKAEELSKNNKHQEALNIFKQLISENRLKDLHHEAYGWVIYRHIKNDEKGLTSIQVRTFLRDYMNLKNERPSLLHSMILNFALHYSKEHSDFNLYKFFELWNPENLRPDDKSKQWYNEKEIPSLISRIFRAFIDNNYNIDYQYLINKIKIATSYSGTSNEEQVLDLLREPYFWKIYNSKKENKYSELWQLFSDYNLSFSKFQKSEWHSKILSLAERYMQETDEWRFLEFFEKWNPNNFMDKDWKEVVKDENTYKPLANKCLKKSFEILKTQASEQNLSWLIQPYETAIKLFPDDEWLLREKALLHFKNNELELAIKIYKQLVLELATKHYVWQEFSNCIISDNPIKIGMLSKALSLEKNEDFLGDIHLDLASALIGENRLENALIELESYKKHRVNKGWKLSSIFDELHKKASSVELNLKDNRELYKKYIPFAEDFAYVDFDWTEVVLADKWKDKKGKERLTFTDGKTIEFVIGKNRFEVFKKPELGQVLKFKLYKQKIKKEVEAKFAWLGKTVVTEHKYVPLLTDKTEKEQWSILEDTTAIVDYINKGKNIVHAITTENKEVFFPQIKTELQIGDFVTAKIFTRKVKDENRTELRQIKKTDKYSSISKFQTQVAIVDGVNEQKVLFHFVISSSLQGIVKFSETDLRPKEGDFIKISFASKTGRDRKLRLKVLNVELTEEINPTLRKDITGLLEMKYKNYNYEEDVPDFAFIGDYYVPKYLLEKHEIITDRRVNARAIYAGDKWKVIELQEI